MNADDIPISVRELSSDWRVPVTHGDSRDEDDVMQTHSSSFLQPVFLYLPELRIP